MLRPSARYLAPDKARFAADAAAKILADANWFEASKPSADELYHHYLDLKQTCDEYLDKAPTEIIRCAIRGVSIVAMQYSSGMRSYDYGICIVTEWRD